MFSVKHSPFKVVPGLGVFWSRGFGRIALVRNGRSAIFAWTLGDGQSYDRIFDITSMRSWNPPNQTEELTDEERNMVRAALVEIYEKKKGERLGFR